MTASWRYCSMEIWLNVAAISGNRKEPEACLSASKTWIPLKVYNQEGLGSTAFSNYPAKPHIPSYRLWLSKHPFTPLLLPINLDTPHPLSSFWHCSCPPSRFKIKSGLPRPSLPAGTIGVNITSQGTHRILDWKAPRGHLYRPPIKPSKPLYPPTGSSHTLSAMERSWHHIISQHITDGTQIFCIAIEGNYSRKHKSGALSTFSFTPKER